MKQRRETCELHESDLPTIVAICNATIPTRQAAADTVEVTVDSRLEWLRQHSPDKLPLMVHEQNKIKQIAP